MDNRWDSTRLAGAEGSSAANLAAYRTSVPYRYGTLVGAGYHVALLATFAALGVRVLAAFDLLSVALLLSAWAANRRGRFGLTVGLAFAEVVTHQVLAVAVIGWASGFQYWLILLLPLPFYLPSAHRALKLPMFAIAAGTYAVLYATLRQATPSPPLPDAVLSAFA